MAFNWNEYFRKEMEKKQRAQEPPQPPPLRPEEVRPGMSAETRERAKQELLTAMRERERGDFERLSKITGRIWVDRI